MSRKDQDSSKIVYLHHQSDPPWIYINNNNGKPATLIKCPDEFRQNHDKNNLYLNIHVNKKYSIIVPILPNPPYSSNEYEEGNISHKINCIEIDLMRNIRKIVTIFGSFDIQHNFIFKYKSDNFMVTNLKMNKKLEKKLPSLRREYRKRSNYPNPDRSGSSAVNKQTKTLSLNMPQDLLNRIKFSAKTDGATLSNWASQAIEAFLLRSPSEIMQERHETTDTPTVLARFEVDRPLAEQVYHYSKLVGMTKTDWLIRAFQARLRNQEVSPAHEASILGT